MQFFSDVFLCNECSALASEHRRKNVKIRSEFEVYVHSDAQSFGNSLEVAEETDNKKLKKFVTRNMEVLSKGQIHSVLDFS